MRAIRSLVAGIFVAGVTAASAAAQQPPQTLQQVRPVLDSLARDPNGITLGDGDLSPGDRTIDAKTHIAGSAGTWHGTLTVLGTIDGNAIALGGDVIIGKGARVRGDAFSLGGNVINQGGPWTARCARSVRSPWVPSAARRSRERRRSGA
ncbi:MAG TPA: hypothetical protein VL980_05165, partial [Gemmatimonadaceae bacterium]|nr:hypothetical protein [Gemmatimonadaceae bacterium]